MAKKSLWYSLEIGVRFILRWLSYILTAATTLLYICSAFSPHIPPKLFSPAALLGLFFPLAFMGQLLAWSYWLVRRRWRILIGLSLIFAFSWESIYSYMPLHRGLSRQLEEYQGPRLKVLSYNVCGFGFEHHGAQRPNKVLLYLKSSEADLICLQEASLAQDKDWGVTMGQVKAYLGKQYPYISLVPAQEGGSGLMLLSRYPIKEAERISIPSRTNGAAHFKINIGGQETHVINVHLESFRLSNALGQEYMSLVAKGKAFEFQDALRSKFTPIFRHHERQANIVKRYADSLQTERLIICGDFNDTPVSYAHEKLERGMTDAFIKAGNGLGYSFVSRTFLVRIDHILLGKAFTPYYTKVDAGVKGSDHYPIFTYIKPTE